MNAQELYLKNGNPTGVWFCEKCRNVARSQELADKCCVPYVCKECGKETEKRFHSICWDCEAKKERVRNQERFDKATKVSDLNYNGWVTDGDEGFWPDTAEYLESLDGEEPAAYLWACTARQFVKVHKDRIYEQISEDAYDDFECGDLDGTPALEAAIAAFEAANTRHICYEADYTRAVLVTKEEPE